MNYKKYNDYELIYMVRENDDISKNVLFDKYLPVIKNMANNYYTKLKGYNCDYDDFFQEAMIAFNTALHTYDERKNSMFYSYVILCINRSLMTFCRNITSLKKNYLLQDFVDADISKIADKNSDIDIFVRQKEIESIIKDVILSLPLDVSSVFELKVNGFKYCEIAKLLDIPSSTVEFRCRKAMNKFRFFVSKLC